MQFSFYFSLCGIILLLVIFILNCINNNFPTRTNIVYKYLILTCIFCNLIECFTIYYEHYLPYNNILVKQIIYFMYIGMCNIEPFLYYLFILSICYEQIRFKKRDTLVILLPFLYELVTLASNPFTNFVYYFTESGVYQRNVGVYSYYIINVYLIILCILELIKSDSPKMHIAYTMAFSSLIFIGLLIQILCKDCIIIGFCLSISFLIINYIIRNPRELRDPNNGTYNRFAFKEYYFHKENRLKEKVLALVQLSNFDVIMRNYGSSNCYAMLRHVIPIVLEKTGIKYAFYLFHNSFVFTCDDTDSALEILEYIKWYMPSPKDVKNVITYDSLHHVQVDRDSFIISDMSFLDNINSGETNKLDVLTELLQYAVLVNTNHNSINIIDNKLVNDFISANKRRKAMHDAIQKQSFEVYMQPIYDLKLKAFTGVESLLRLKDENGDFIPPSLFIPDAEKDGSIIKLGEISLRKTCEYIRYGNLVQKGIKKVNINLSMIQCMQDNIVEKIINILDEYQIPPTLIRFEITETVMATNPDQLAAVMRGLGEFGIEFALDDYGTGYSNTSRLLSFPFSEIKFDKSFVNSILVDDKNSIPLKHLMSMVKSSGMLTLVEGVEEKETSDLIEEFGGDLIQGFYYAKPMPLEEFKKTIK